MSSMDTREMAIFRCLVRAVVHDDQWYLEEERFHNGVSMGCRVRYGPVPFELLEPLRRDLQGRFASHMKSAVAYAQKFSEAGARKGLPEAG